MKTKPKCISYFFKKYWQRTSALLSLLSPYEMRRDCSLNLSYYFVPTIGTCSWEGCNKRQENKDFAICSEPPSRSGELEGVLVGHQHPKNEAGGAKPVLSISYTRRGSAWHYLPIPLVLGTSRSPGRLLSANSFMYCIRH